MNTKYDKNKLLPNWGPYSKKYMGISRIVENETMGGVRFDCTVFPTIANSAVPVPNVTVPSNFHPWECKEDLSYYSYRYDLEWKDKVYADVSFSKINEKAYLIRAEFVNHTDMQQNCLLNLFSAVEYPMKRYIKLELPEKHTFWDALAYNTYEYTVKRPWDKLNPDGAKKGEFFDEDFVGYKGLGDRVDHGHVGHLALKPFGAVAGDCVSYRIETAEHYEQATIAIRYRTVGDMDNSGFQLQLDAKKMDISFQKSDDLKIIMLPIGALKIGKHMLTFSACGTGGIELDCMAIVEQEDQGEIIVQPMRHNCIPSVSIDENQVTYRYENIEETINVTTLCQNVRCRELHTGALEDALITRLSNADHTFDDVMNPFTHSFSRKHSDEGYFHNVIAHSIYVQPQRSEVVYAIVSENGFDKKSMCVKDCEVLYQKNKNDLSKIVLNQLGRPYELSNNILRATTLTNIVYPIYKNGGYIKHHTPGKRWDCLYTWDSGFIGLGFLEYEPGLSEYILDTYLSEKNNKDFAFLHHGSPVPVHIYLYWDMLKRAENKDRLYTYYDRAKMMYDFLAGKDFGSTTARFKSGLTSTYDYFYNASGMDDLPPQVLMHKQKLQGVTTPAIATSQVIRCAKILRIIAEKAGHHEDVQTYEDDIKRLTDALHKYSWDEKSGYFSYVVHDENLEPKTKLETPEGENVNKGMDGIYPIMAGACTEEQKKRILQHLKSREEMFSQVGISAVDMSSGYYIDNGYWNGNVWFSHQWFIWKAMLDIGEMDFAFQIAQTALDAWKTEVDYSYYTFEMLNIETGRGGWFHNFGGLSTPINIWANAYYKKGTVSTGFELWLEQVVFSDDCQTCEIGFECFPSGGNDACSMIVVMDDSKSNAYKVELDEHALAFVERMPGVIEISLENRIEKGKIVIS